jgi:hypothetical protein
MPPTAKVIRGITEENKAMYRDLTGILASSLLGGIGIAIDLAAQKQIIPGALPLAYYRAFLECVERAANVAENLGEVAELTFDISTENEYNARLLYAWARNGDARFRKWLAPEISFVPWRESPRVQTADLLAFEAWKALDHTVGPVKPDPQQNKRALRRSSENRSYTATVL